MQLQMSKKSRSFVAGFSACVSLIFAKKVHGKMTYFEHNMIKKLFKYSNFLLRVHQTLTVVRIQSILMYIF